MGKRQKTYEKENFIRVIYSLIDANKTSTSVIDKNKINMLSPIDGAYSGYLTNKIQFEDSRDGKLYVDKWKRGDTDNEEDRLNVIRKMNKRIHDYNKYVKNHEEELGIDKINQWKYYPLDEIPEWSLNIYLATPTLRKTDSVISHKTINNRWFYQKATKIPRLEYAARFNKTIYDWIIDMLPKSFNDDKIKFLSDKHILFQPKLEFENWFMKNGLLINDTPSLFNDFKKENRKSFSELEIYKNEARIATKKLKEMTHKYRLAKDPPRSRVDKMIEESSLDDFIDINCRKKNGKLNWAELGRQLGCHADTARKIILETGLTYLFDDSKNTYLE